MLNIPRAVRSNRIYLRRVSVEGARPVQRFNQILHLFGYTSHTPGEEEFAHRVAAWQQANFPGREPDGMLGLETWRKLEPLTRFSVDLAALPGWLRNPSATAATEASAGAGNPEPPPVIQGPTRAGAFMVGSSGRSRVDDRAFSSEEMVAHQQQMEVMAAADALGRLHAVMHEMAWGGPDYETLTPNNYDHDPLPGGVADSYGTPPADSTTFREWTEEGEQFAEAREAGLIRQDRETGRFASSVPQTDEFRDLVSEPDFVEIFNEAARDHWDFLRFMELVDKLLSILDAFDAAASLFPPSAPAAMAGVVTRRLFTSVTRNAVRSAGRAGTRQAARGLTRVTAATVHRALLTRLRPLVRRVIAARLRRAGRNLVPEFVEIGINLNRETARTGGIRRITGRLLPDGRTSIKIEGTLLPSMGQAAPRYNRRLSSARSVGLPDYEISHLWGPGFGDEAWDGMMYAPREVNQQWMNHTIESRLRELQELAGQSGSSIEVSAVAVSHPPGTHRGQLLLQELQYEFSLRRPNSTSSEFLGRITLEVSPPPYRAGTAVRGVDSLNL